MKEGVLRLAIRGGSQGVGEIGDFKNLVVRGFIIPDWYKWSIFFPKYITGRSDGISDQRIAVERKRRFLCEKRSRLRRGNDVRIFW